MPIYNPEPRLFLNNKFTNCYFFMVTKAKRLDRVKKNVNDPDFSYYESHHIIPRALGGSDKPQNLVLLTAYEHFLCHWLLTKMCVSGDHRRKMLYPLRCMTNKKRLISLRNLATVYEESKTEISKVISDSKSGTTRSEATKIKISEANRGQNNPMFGKHHSNSTARKMSEAKTGDRNPNHQRDFSEDHRSRISQTNRERNTYEFTNKTFLIVWPDGKEEIVTNRRAFANQHEFRAGSISTAAVTGRPYRGLKISYVKRA